MDRLDPGTIGEALRQLLEDIGHAPPRSRAERAFEAALWAHVRARLQDVQAPPQLLARIRLGLALEEGEDSQPWITEGVR